MSLVGRPAIVTVNHQTRYNGSLTNYKSRKTSCSCFINARIEFTYLFAPAATHV